MLAALKDDGPDDVEEGSAGEGKVSPLVAGLQESTDETADDHDLVREDGDKDGGPGQTGRQEQVHQQQRGGDEPVHVPDPEDLAGDDAVVLGVAGPLELDADGDLAEVGAHAEVGDGGDHEEARAHVVEDALVRGLCQRQADDGEAGHGHDGAHGKVPVGAMGGNVLGRGPEDVAVDVESLVAAHGGRFVR